MSEQVANPTAVMEAVEGFVHDGPDGMRYIVVPGQTRVAADHYLVQHFPQHFRATSDHLSYQVEDATADPGARRLRGAGGKATILDQVGPSENPTPKVSRKRD